MVDYKCNLCNKIFNKKSTFDDHQLRKRPCNKEKNIVKLKQYLSKYELLFKKIKKWQTR